ncbi:asparaginase [Sphaerimonospora thailandensis]|uniref:L-asparaginase n=1 Tax=Sphaerimonospora thailandensis TaxID=795644 RepID=A0A8J3RC07_9ACTN|nr:asparaginase [Sphaerimonospora thailandensis]GIH73331.1 L-asparaginase [Sphaerimonospora thailandensis]
MPDQSRSILVVTLGGTIAMTKISGETGGVTPRLTGADLVAAVPGLDEGTAITVEDFRRVPGASLTVDDIAELARRLREAAATGTDGFVITQGTDTLEETAFLLDLLYDADAPLVLTGAMRNAAMPGADGPANLLAAVRTAAGTDARGLGALVVFADEIHAARHVRKVHSTSIAAFASPGAGPIGHVIEGAPRLHFTLERHRPVPPPVRPAAVEIVHTTLGGDSSVLDDLARRADGVVVAAFGAGHVPQTWGEPLQALAERIPVVLASRTGAGSVLAGTYAFPGSESDLLARGLISAGPLDPYKARLLLLAHLRAGADRATVEAAFTERR